MIALLAVVLLGFLVGLVRSGPDAGEVAAGLVPALAGTETLLLACGILGATVMPHVIYLHASLTDERARQLDREGRRRLLTAQRLDIPVAMALAGLVNLAMLVLAATVFPGTGVDTIEEAHAGLGETLGRGSALAFALARLVSGFAASSHLERTGRHAGLPAADRPLTLRRAVTLAPALLVLAVGVDPTRALVLSQVVLSFGIPFALVPLVLLTRRPDVMGEFVNRRRTTAAAAVVAALISALNLFLLAQLA